MGCQGASVQVQRLMPKTQQDLLRRDPLSLCSVPQYRRAKGLFHPGTRKNQGLALSQLQKRALSVPSFPCEPPFHAPSQGPRHRGVDTHLYMYSLDHLWQVTFPLSSNVSSPGHPGPSVQPVADPCRPNWPDLLPICRNEPWLNNCSIWTLLC